MPESNSPPENFDVNKVVGEFLVKFLNDNIEKMIGAGKKTLLGAKKDFTDEVRLRLNSSYKDYVTCVAERYSRAKTFLIRQDPTDLYKFYVPLDISSDKQTCEQASISDVTLTNNFAVLRADGGSGKSLMMRHLFLDTLRLKQKVPVLIELRAVNKALVLRDKNVNSVAGNTFVRMTEIVKNETALEILANSNMDFSLKTIKKMLAVKKTLIEKQRRTAASLEEILG